MGLGGMLYPGYRRSFFLPDLSESSIAGVLAYLGQKSLAIYLIHQPVIIALLYLGGVPLGLLQNWNHCEIY
jgi:uncharacterized membrane protein